MLEPLDQQAGEVSHTGGVDGSQNAQFKIRQNELISIIACGNSIKGRQQQLTTKMPIDNRSAKQTIQIVATVQQVKRLIRPFGFLKMLPNESLIHTTYLFQSNGQCKRLRSMADEKK
ncbi:MAG: hypothetical protein KDD92_11755 [Caldilineaceae bacterium]|nr:hypothetical protein [Caldilineaceae bacterium]